MNPQTSYGYSTTVQLSFDDAVQKTIELLKEQGFGILTTIDVKAKMKEKMNLDMEDYLILGACNPKLAAQALQAEKEVGLLMPCNVLVYQHKDQTRVSAQLPSTMMSVTGNKLVCEVADQAEQTLKKVIDQLSKL
jgi:uncharacterized protein (DUF302 family)